ncbi:YfgM family protein [Thiospirillum jenense]|nr:tetratricopeptide repeat protein [Thiospirillum jenense]
MADLMTDDEKVEAIRTWWRENGLAVGIGIALGVAIVFGWRAWVFHQSRIQQQASFAFEQLLMTASADKPELKQITAQTDAIIADYSKTPYAMFAQLALAKAAVEQGDLTTAIKTLRSAIKTAPDAALAKLAALRLLQVFIAAGDYQAAAEVLKKHDDGGSFTSEFAALRGDLAVAENRLDDARVAYQAALTLGAGSARLIELKLRELPAGKSPPAPPLSKGGMENDLSKGGSSESKGELEKTAAAVIPATLTVESDKSNSAAAAVNSDKSNSPAAAVDSDKINSPAPAVDSDKSNSPAPVESDKTNSPAPVNSDKSNSPAPVESDKTNSPAAAVDSDKINSPAPAVDSDKPNSPAPAVDSNKPNSPAPAVEPDKPNSPTPPVELNQPAPVESGK